VKGLCPGYDKKKSGLEKKKNMAIHFVTGRPGAGKGLYSMKLLVEEIQGTNRAIVTNLALLPEKLAEYMHNQFGQSFDLLTRLQMVHDDELSEFFCYRGPGHGKLECTKDEKGRAYAYDIATAMSRGGVFYLLDEVHLAFGARDWMNTGRAVMYYASQHRKLGDDVIMVTQAPKNVESQFRSLAQDYTTVRNHGMEKMFFFKQPKVFSRQTFLNMPTGAQGQKPMEKGIFRMNLKVANCYDTAQGVGIHERGEADKGKDRRKGISWMWILGIIGIVILGLTQLPRLLSTGAEKMISVATDGAKKGLSPLGIENKKDATNAIAGAALAALTNRLVGVPTNQVVRVAETAIVGQQTAVVPIVDKPVDNLTIIGVKPFFVDGEPAPVFWDSRGRKLEIDSHYEYFNTKGVFLLNGDLLLYDINGFSIRTILEEK